MKENKTCDNCDHFVYSYTIGKKYCRVYGMKIGLKDCPYYTNQKEK